MLKVYIDGACEPFNPGGTASYGVIVYRDKEQIFSASEILGEGPLMSNNVAEYAALIAFLKWFNGIDPEPVTIFSDSMMLVKQMGGEWQARGGLYLDSYQEAKKLSAFKPITFVWIPREQNIHADDLSTRVLIDAGIKVVKR